mmetsp:Transcript_33349/g.80663  ORF Transcript_33349/g.80663 Transcript_33349/m.80663 type:complete len:243 (+) Transcript_33349:703-1431(+)
MITQFLRRYYRHGLAAPGDVVVGAVGIVTGRDHRIRPHHQVVVELGLCVGGGHHKHVPMLRRGDLVREHISHQTSFHPIVDEPAVPIALIHDPQISPCEKIFDGRSCAVQLIEDKRCLLPRFGISDIPQYIVILHHTPTNITNHHDHLIAHVAPSPDPFVMRVIRLDERMVAHAQKLEVPFVLGRPSRQRLHLDEDHSLIPRGEAGDDSLLEVDAIRNFVRGRLPFAVAAAEVQAEAACHIG